MNILQALEQPIFRLPKINDKENFPELLKDVFVSFLEAVDQINEGTITDKLKENKKCLKAVCDALIESLNSYYLGFPAKAYLEFEQAMVLLEPFLFPDRKGMTVIKEREQYYRARVGANTQFERKEMFHMPFEKREYVTTQRFSVPGLPCLYLANSVYVCWEELRRPDINKMQVSRFKLENHKLKFLDISLTPSYLAKILTVTTTGEMLERTEKSHEEALDRWDILTLEYLMKWPIIAACSIKVKKQDGSFKPEYIFPQFLLQWVTSKKDIDGIKYFSVEANISSKVDHSQLINYTLPVKEVKSSGLCPKLIEFFSLTEPVSWDFLSMANPGIVQHDKEKFKERIAMLDTNNLIGALEFVKGMKMYYWLTIFGKIEIEIAAMKFEKIDIP